MIKFGTDGWRAIISDEFTFENVRKVAQAIADYLNLKLQTSNIKINPKSQPQIIIGYDARFLADQFALEIAKVMKENGISSLVTERDTPTPIVAWSVKDKNVLGAIMLTASHNPPEYCGIKFIPHYAGPATEEITKEIEAKLPTSNAQRPSKSQIPTSNAQIEHFEPRERYFEYIEKFIDVEAIKKAKLKILYDPMYGSGRGYLDKLLVMYGCQVEEIHNYRDVLFGGQNPEPGDKELTELKAKVLEGKFDLGLANDGDADRFGVVDERGNFLDANKVLSLLFNYLITTGGRELGSVVRSIATTSLIDEIAKEHDIKVHETKVGFKYIAEIMMKEPVLIGGEESGGLSINGHIPEKDGILADLLVVEMAAKTKKPLSQLWRELVKKYGSYEFKRGKVETTDEKKNALMEKLKKAPPSEIGGMKVENVKTSDGVKLILEDKSWVLVRPSGTEPVLRIYYESKDPEVLKLIAQFAKGLV
ncbi:MAG: phosphoglucomutase/phosphomannomutase family protein [Candidatus Saganbacteria bacterium]|nr:phosphoglucomutase/phosphomannomutase family protein [Candidatus Saganbacteria bacterium]